MCDIATYAINSYMGKHNNTNVYYHRSSRRCREWWIALEGSEGERMFEEERTPQIVPTPKAYWEVEKERKLLDEDHAAMRRLFAEI